VQVAVPTTFVNFPAAQFTQFDESADPETATLLPTTQVVQMIAPMLDP